MDTEQSVAAAPEAAAVEVAPVETAAVVPEVIEAVAPVAEIVPVPEAPAVEAVAVPEVAEAPPIAEEIPAVVEASIEEAPVAEVAAAEPEAVPAEAEEVLPPLESDEDDVAKEERQAAAEEAAEEQAEEPILEEAGVEAVQKDPVLLEVEKALEDSDIKEYYEALAPADQTRFRNSEMKVVSELAAQVRRYRANTKATLKVLEPLFKSLPATQVHWATQAAAIKAAAVLELQEARREAAKTMAAETPSA